MDVEAAVFSGDCCEVCWADAAAATEDWNDEGRPVVLKDRELEVEVEVEFFFRSSSSTSLERFPFIVSNLIACITMSRVLCAAGIKRTLFISLRQKISENAYLEGSRS